MFFQCRENFLAWGALEVFSFAAGSPEPEVLNLWLWTYCVSGLSFSWEKREMLEERGNYGNPIQWGLKSTSNLLYYHSMIKCFQHLIICILFVPLVYEENIKVTRFSPAKLISGCNMMFPDCNLMFASTSSQNLMFCLNVIYRHFLVTFHLVLSIVHLRILRRGSPRLLYNPIKSFNIADLNLKSGFDFVRPPITATYTQVVPLFHNFMQNSIRL